MTDTRNPAIDRFLARDTEIRAEQEARRLARLTDSEPPEVGCSVCGRSFSTHNANACRRDGPSE